MKERKDSKKLIKKNSKGKVLPYFDKGVYRKYANGALIHRGRLKRWIRYGFEKSAYQHQVNIPFISNPIFKRKSNKNKANTYNVYDLDCRKYCIYANKCTRFYHRIQKGKAIACQDFEGEYINLQVCEKCERVRYIESPVKLIVKSCPKCKGIETDDNREDPRMFHNRKARMIYLKAKQKKLRELRNE